MLEVLDRLDLDHSDAPRGNLAAIAQASSMSWASMTRIRPGAPLPRQTAEVTIAYTLGWRMHSEVLPLQRRHLDLEAGTPFDGGSHVARIKMSQRCTVI